MTITADLLKQLRVEINAALEAIASRHNITLKAANASYDADRFTFKLEGERVGAESAEAKFYRLNQAFRRWPDLGSVFSVGRQQYRIDGMKTRGSKPVQITRLSDDKQLLCGMDFLPVIDTHAAV